MAKKILTGLVVIVVVIVLYFLTWPVPADPVAWEAPPNPGYTGPFEPNTRLKGMETFPIGKYHGPEDIALDGEGRIYAATHEGVIVRLQADGSSPEAWAETGGRPLGIDFDGEGNLIVADAYKGLLSISPDGKVSLLADTADGIPILYADDVDVAKDGKIYFSDASTKFSAKAVGDTMAASVLDLMDHGGYGRLLVYDPATGKATKVVDGLQFANGVAVGHDQTYVLVNETGAYRVMRHWISGPKKGQTEALIEHLPSFPDNVSTGLNGRYWVALVSPRNPLVDNLAGKPFLRKVVLRMPKFMQPKAEPYGHIIAVDTAGNVLENMHDRDGAYPINTSITETEGYIYIGSLVTPVIGRLSKAKAGIK